MDHRPTSFPPLAVDLLHLGRCRVLDDDGVRGLLHEPETFRDGVRQLLALMILEYRGRQILRMD
jgi:hypothetical protein